MVIIRADGNAKIGAGHIMRCLTVAEAVGEILGNRENICFLCADGQSAGLVTEYGFRAEILGTEYHEMETELPAWEHLLRNLGSAEHTILVDSYFVTDRYLEELGEFGRVCLLDDMQENAYPADVVINYNAFADREVYEKLYSGTGTEIVTGSSYVPIREQFQNRIYQVAESVKHVLITTGGGDQDNIAGAILKTVYCSDYEFHVVTGRYNPHLEELKAWERAESSVHIYHDVKDMAGLMQKCDIAITAGGTTIYELAAIGVPFLCFSYAENQEALTEYIGAYGIAGFAGAYHREPQAAIKKMKALFLRYCEQYELRQKCSEAEKRMIDGHGAERIAQILLRQA